MLFAGRGKERKHDEEKKAEIEEAKSADGRAFTVTLSLLGTGYHLRNPDCQCALTQLIKTIEPGSMQAAYVINGPGATVKSDKKNKKDYPSFVSDEKADSMMLGEYKAEFKFNPETGEINVKKTKRAFFDRATKAGGLVLGTGTDDARDEVMSLAEAIINSGKAPVVFNIVAFSRGADTAIRVANDLQARYGSDVVKVNICAVDPVPGPLREAHEAHVIPRCVDDFVGIYMLGEDRPGFEPTSDLIFEDPTHTKASFQIYGGKHGDGHRENYPQGDPRNYSAELGRMQIENFLKRNGSNIKYTIPIVRLDQGKKLLEMQEVKTPLDEVTIPLIEAHYDVLRFEMYTHLAALRGDQSVAGWFSSGRTFASRKFEFILHGHDYFINKEHQELFKKFFPHYFDYFFQSAAEKTTAQQVQQEMNDHLLKDWGESIAEAKKGSFTEKLFTSLKKSGYVFPDKMDEEKFPKPKGIKLIAQSTTDRPDVKGEHKSLAYDELSQLIYSIQASSRYASLLGAPANVADELCSEIQGIIKRVDYSFHTDVMKDFLAKIGAPSSVLKDEVESFYASTLSKCRFAVFKAYLKLNEAGYKGPFYYQLQEIIDRSPPLKLLFSFMEIYPKKLPEIVVNFLSSTATHMEEVLAHPEFDEAQRQQTMDQQLKKAISLFLRNNRSATGELRDAINAVQSHIESQLIGPQEVYYLDWQYISKKNSQANMFIYQELKKFAHDKKTDPFSKKLCDLFGKVSGQISMNYLQADFRLLSDCINQLITAAAQHRRAEGLKKALPIETLLRQFQIMLSTFQSKELPADKIEVRKEIFEGFLKGLEGLKTAKAEAGVIAEAKISKRS